MDNEEGKHEDVSRAYATNILQRQYGKIPYTLLMLKSELQFASLHTKTLVLVQGIHKIQW